MAVIKDMGEKIQTTAGTFTKKQYEASKEGLNGKKGQLSGDVLKPFLKKCPFRHQTCSMRCALNVNNECSLVTGKPSAGVGVCPFSSINRATECDENCALFDSSSGCALCHLK